MKRESGIDNDSGSGGGLKERIVTLCGLNNSELFDR